MTSVTLNGNAYSDDGTQTRDMRGGGHRNWLLPMLSDALTEVDAATDAAVSADSSAAAASVSAVEAANYAAALKGTSATVMTPATGSKTFATQSGKQWGVGQIVLAVSAGDATHWIGRVGSSGYSNSGYQGGDSFLSAGGCIYNDGTMHPMDGRYGSGGSGGDNGLYNSGAGGDGIAIFMW